MHCQHNLQSSWTLWARGYFSLSALLVFVSFPKCPPSSNTTPIAVAQNSTQSMQGSLPPMAPEWTKGYTDPTESQWLPGSKGRNMLENIMQTRETMGSSKQMQVLKLQPDLHPAARPAPRACWKMQQLRSETMQGEQIWNRAQTVGCPAPSVLKIIQDLIPQVTPKKVSTSSLVNKK